MLTLRLLNVFTSGSYEPMTFPHFRPRLKDISTHGPTVAVGAACEGRPIGLGLAKVSPDRRCGNILSVFVAAAQCNRGIGTALVARLEAELHRRGCTELELAYLTETPSTLAIQRILEKLHWSVPQARMLVCQGNRRILEAPWIRRCPLPAGFSIFPWCKLAPDDRNAIRRRQALQPWYPEILSPFHHEATLEPINSLGLRYQGEVVGWLITHRVSREMVRYSSLFVRADVRGKGCGLPLLAEALRRHSKMCGVDSIGLFGVWLDNKPMVRFVRRLTPFLLSVRETRGSHKNLLGECSSSGHPNG